MPVAASDAKVQDILRRLQAAQDTADYAAMLAKGAGMSQAAGGSAPTTNFADNETPTGAINGVNATFTLAHSPSPAASLILALNNGIAVQGVDFTLAGATITMTTAPNTGETLRALTYRY